MRWDATGMQLCVLRVYASALRPSKAMRDNARPFFVIVEKAGKLPSDVSALSLHPGQYGSSGHAAREMRFCTTNCNETPCLCNCEWSLYALGKYVHTEYNGLTGDGDFRGGGG